MKKKSDLVMQTCEACDGGTEALKGDAIGDFLKQVPGWKAEKTKIPALCRVFKFKNYFESMAFVNATAWISHRENHHPDIELGYNQVTMRYSTHAVKGITMNDFICAAKVDAMMGI